MQRLKIFCVVAAIMLIGTTCLSGYVLPLVFHHMLKVVGLEMWVDCGIAYSPGTIFVVAPPGNFQIGWWKEFVRDAELQLQALPAFAMLSVLAALGAAVWSATKLRPVPLWLAAILGAIPGLALVIVVAWINASSFSGVATEMPRDLPRSGWFIVMGLWAWLVSRSLLMAAGAAITAKLANRYILSDARMLG